MSAASLLEELEAASVRVVQDGDNLRVRAAPGVSLATYAPALKDAKPANPAELRLRERIVAAATADPADFDRAAYDQLWQEWHEPQEQAP